MSDFQREITSRNVDALLEVIKSEREARYELYNKIVAMEKHIQMLTSRIQLAESNAHAALAVARGMNGSAVGD
jgi:hypothetical protein